ncbi:hypothetical protein [Microbacterium cremeum]|uniref:hypothetical protein n=1 Tax=Microbacterium cremeum TaxID=2782169 RepID=UPI001E58B4DE|nr:hypothetical protein [Microbacterium cremeum]
MEIATSQLPKAVRLALIGAATAFAWIVLSLALGLGASHANADDSDRNGLLGGALGAVTSLVDDTASTVTSTVSTVTTGVKNTVNTVVSVAPAPVQQPVSQVVQTVGTVVNTVTQPVTEVVSGGVVSGITEPVVGIVAEVPVVGGIVSGIGLDDAVTDLGKTVDDTLGGVVGAVDETGSNIGQPPVDGSTPGGLPPVPGLPGLPALPGLVDGPQAPDAVAPGAAAVIDLTDAWTTVISPAAALRAAWDAASAAVWHADNGSIFSATAPAGHGGVPGSAGGLCPLASSSAGSGGAGPGAWAVAALLPLVAHRAWVRRAGAEDDRVPPAPAGSTDVSPD